jgi:hypothetical protein
MDINLHSKNINLHSPGLYIEISAISVTAAYSPSAVKKEKEKKGIGLPHRQKAPSLVAEIIKENNDIRLDYLAQTNDYNEALTMKFSGYPGLPIQERTHVNVMDVFLKRLPPISSSTFTDMVYA